MDKNFENMLSDRFGMFVHYGLYSAFGGRYRGECIKGLGEWIQRWAQIPISEYVAFAKENFCPSEDFAKNLVASARAAGVRYIALTSKHHDGFCLFKSEADPYNSYELFGRDICAELAEACRAEGLGLGFYYSHCLDWHEKNAGGNFTLTHPDVKTESRNFWDFPDDNIDFSEYFRRKCLPQVRELLTNYGDLKCIWFDYPHDITREESLELRKLVKQLQPNCLINSRIGHGFCDYYSLGDNGLPTAPARVPTECLITLNDTWAYKSDDLNYKSPEGVTEILCRTLSTGASLLMNVGPMSDGSLTSETENILAYLGEWTSRNAEAIYGGIKPSPFKCTFPWGYAASGERSIYLYLKEGIANIKLSGIESTPTSVTLLGGGALEYSFDGRILAVNLGETEIKNPVLKVDFENAPKISDSLTVDSARGTLLAAYASLGSLTSPESVSPLLHEYDVELGDFGKHGTALSRVDTVHHWESADHILVWDVYFAECGEYEAEIVSAEPGFETQCSRPDADTPCTLSVGNMSNSALSGIKCTYNVSATSVNLRHVRDGGKFKIEKVGKYRVTLAKDNDTLGLGVIEVRFKKTEGGKI